MFDLHMLLIKVYMVEEYISNTALDAFATARHGARVVASLPRFYNDRTARFFALPKVSASSSPPFFPPHARAPPTDLLPSRV